MASAISAFAYKWMPLRYWYLGYDDCGVIGVPEVYNVHQCFTSDAVNRSESKVI